MNWQKKKKKGFYFTQHLFCAKTHKKGTRKLRAGGDGFEESGGLSAARDPQDKDPGTGPRRTGDSGGRIRGTFYSLHRALNPLRPRRVFREKS